MDKQIPQKDSNVVKPQLPLELVFKILDYFLEDRYIFLVNQGYTGRDGYGRPVSLLRQSILAHLSSKCRLWHAVLIPLLYRAPRITYRYQAQKFRECLEVLKDFGGFVRCLNWPLTPRQYDFDSATFESLQKDLFQLCPNLEEIVVWRTDERVPRSVQQYFLTDILDSRVQLKRIALINFGILADKYITQIPSSFPLLEVLDLTGTRIHLKAALVMLSECKKLTKLLLVKNFKREGRAAIETAQPSQLVIQYTSRRSK